MASHKQSRVLITGGSTYIGIHLAAALLAQGADVSLVIQPGTEARLGALASRVHWQSADVWDSAALKGRARGHGTVIHTVGSLTADPSRGLTYHRLNVVSARNAANMCVSDGVPHFMLLSTVRAPWIHRDYFRAKRDAEAYVRRIGLKTSILRIPITYQRGQKRPAFFRLMTLLGSILPLSWTHLGRMAPAPIDMITRAIGSVALDPPEQTRIFYAGHLRRLSRDVVNAQPASSLEETDRPSA